VRDDAQVVDVGEAPDESLGDAVGQVFLRGISGQVAQGQDGE
jgi:hypothetical protein